MAESGDHLGEEVRRLADAMQEWARRFLEPKADDDGRPARAAECLPWCPICQFANILRGEHPEVTERLTEAATSFAAAMKALAEVALTWPQAESSRARPRPAPRVEHIRIDEPGEA
jgi:DNA-binding HxlR family transcriptional regulator